MDPLNLEYLNQAKNIPVALPRSPICSDDLKISFIKNKNYYTVFYILFDNSHMQILFYDFSLVTHFLRLFFHNFIYHLFGFYRSKLSWITGFKTNVIIIVFTLYILHCYFQFNHKKGL